MSQKPSTAWSFYCKRHQIRWQSQKIQKISKKQSHQLTRILAWKTKYDESVILCDHVVIPISVDTTFKPPTRENKTLKAQSILSIKISTIKVIEFFIK